MSANVFDFDKSRSDFVTCIQKTKNFENIDAVIRKFSNDKNGSDSEKKTALDQAFRDCLKHLVIDGSACPIYKSLINLSVLAVKNELCAPSTPFLVMSDVFDTVTLDKCDDIFSYVEDGVLDWKSELFYGAGKNYLLRMCNDLLRRLSKSQNTVFCGRIQLFLSRLFPLSEKSGLNLMSQFHVDNITKYDLKVDMTHFKETGEKSSKEVLMDTEEGEMNEHLGSIPIDYNMYRKFWSLQDYFRSPLQCYEKVAWRQFVANATEVLNAFSSYKLADVKMSNKKLEQMKDSKPSRAFFAKYLTSSKLLDLQLSDSNFRRYVCVQFLILFQYLNASIKFKGNDHVLHDDQSNWIKETCAKVIQLIKETPPDGVAYSDYIQHILQREENWNTWKNEGCPNFVREKSGELKSKQRKKRSLGDDIRGSGGKMIKMGCSELTRLWNLCPDNIEACKSEKRVFLPSMDNFFEMAIEAANPEHQVEDQYKDHLKPNWQWTALRLLARKSPHFFSPTNQPGKPLAQYLETLFAKMEKEIKSSSQNEDKADDSKVDEGVEEGEQGQDEDLSGTVKDGENDLVTKEQAEMLSERLVGNWKKLGMELNIHEDVVAFVEQENPDEPSRIIKLIKIWQENEADRATVLHLISSLKEIGLLSIATEVFGELKDGT